MADRHDNSHQLSLYLKICCHPSNRGKSLKIQDEMGHKSYILCPSVLPTSCPAFNTSCSQLHEVYPTAPSGYYNILLFNGSQIKVYCDMEGAHCDGNGGWTRVAFVNMSETGSSCPPGLVQYDNIFNTSLCWIYNGTYYHGCNSTLFSTNGLNYTKVCGRVRGYQYGYPFAFYCYIYNNTCFDPEINTYGVTLTYSNNPHKHIWTYAGGWNEATKDSSTCPCNNGSQYMNYIFVGNDYYCESGSYDYDDWVLFPNDPLWDGRDCPGREATCCISPKMPWFVKTLNETVAYDIELSTCGYNDRQIFMQGTPLDLVECYIK